MTYVLRFGGSLGTCLQVRRPSEPPDIFINSGLEWFIVFAKTKAHWPNDEAAAFHASGNKKKLSGGKQTTKDLFITYA